MIECIFTLDYEIYGNGEGSLKELVYEPAQKLLSIFRKFNVSLVVFVEAAELETIESKGTDSAIDLVQDQIRKFHKEGFELGLHLHPQWFNARHHNGVWLLDYSEYNLCTLPTERIFQIVDRSIAYLRKVLGASDFTPLSFRAGNWLLQPTSPAATVIAKRGIKVDSSVFKGGLQHQHELDYRRALKNGHYWRFKDDVNMLDPQGNLLELPIHTRMVPTWQMFTAKRVGLQQQGRSMAKNGGKRLNQFLDLLRFRYPLKFDFCRMTINELTHMVDTVIKEDHLNPGSFKPLVAIGHTKDLVDFETVELLLSYLQKKRIKISTFQEVYPKCN